MKRDLILFVSGAISALLVNAFVFDENNMEPNISSSFQQSDERFNDETFPEQAKKLNDQPTPDIHERPIEPDLLEDSVTSNTTEKADGKAAQVVSIDKKDLPPGFSSKTDYQKAFQDESVDPVQKEKREMAIRELFDQERAFELNVGLQDIECRSERCRLEIFPIDGNSRFFSMMDVMQMFASTEWFGEQVVNFDDPDENGIRVLHFAPTETQELDFLTESEPGS